MNIMDNEACEVPKDAFERYLYSSGTGVLARFEVFTTLKVQVRDLRVVTPCSVAVGYQRFRGLCCLHFQGESYLFLAVRGHSWELLHKTVNGQRVSTSS